MMNANEQLLTSNLALNATIHIRRLHSVKKLNPNAPNLVFHDKNVDFQISDYET